MSVATGIDPRDIGLEIRLGRVGRENLETKARRLLVEGRLQVRLYTPAEVRATCRGTEETHTLGYERGPGWWCSCAARGRCSHLAALELVCTRPDGNVEGVKE